MRWSVDTNNPPLAGKGVTILCDGVPVERVVEFDTAEGWVHAHCMEGGKVHPHPHDPNQVCTRYLHGTVEVVMPEGVAL